jgi:hypothetical protein
MAFDVHQYPEWEQKGGLGAIDAVAITTSDTTTYAPAFRGIYVGGAGNVKIDTAAGNAVTFTGIPAGTFMPVLATKIYATGTTATTIVGLL